VKEGMVFYGFHFYGTKVSPAGLAILVGKESKVLFLVGAQTKQVSVGIHSSLVWSKSIYALSIKSTDWDFSSTATKNDASVLMDYTEK
jgi:hypothetical protein